MSDKPTIQDCMEQAQTFASAWSLVGRGAFGTTLGQATAEKETLKAMLCAALAAPAQAVPAAPGQALDAARVFWQQHTQADALSMSMAKLHDDVELVIRAARGTAQAAPVDAESGLDLLAEARAALWQPANAALCERLDAFIAAARAAQGGEA